MNKPQIKSKIARNPSPAPCRSMASELEKRRIASRQRMELEKFRWNHG